MRLKAMIWDVDGTLVDSEELHRNAFNMAFVECGLYWFWTTDVYRKLLEVTGGKERIRHYIRILGANEHDLPASPEAIHAVKTKFYRQGVRDGALTLRRGVGPILEEAFAMGITLSIATTTSTANVEGLFESGILKREHWKVIVAGEDVDQKKPAPDVYRNVLKKLALEPADCLAVEDSENGLKAAIGAGIPAVVVTNKYTTHQEFGGEIVRLPCFERVAGPYDQDTDPIGMCHFEAWHYTSIKDDE